MKTNGLRVAAMLMPLCIAAGGCMVASSKYEIKTREADTLRDGLAAANKEKSVLEARNEALQTQLSAEKAETASLSARVRALEDEVRKGGEELASARKNYEGTRITREQFIAELLEKEKVTGKRIQELSAAAQSSRQELESLRKESAARDAELAELRKKVGEPGEEEALKRERDILLGRVERLSEERRQEEKRREDRFASLAEFFVNSSKDIKVSPLGPALRIYLPEKVLFAKGKATLSDGGKKLLAEVGKAASEFTSSSILISAGGKKAAEDMRAAILASAKIPVDRIFENHIEREKGAELLLLVP